MNDTQPEADDFANFVMRQVTILTPVINCPKRDLEMCCKLTFRQDWIMRCHLNDCGWLEEWLRLSWHGIMCGRLYFRVDDFSDGCDQAGDRVGQAMKFW